MPTRIQIRFEILPPNVPNRIDLGLLLNGCLHTQMVDRVVDLSLDQLTIGTAERILDLHPPTGFEPQTLDSHGLAILG